MMQKKSYRIRVGVYGDRDGQAVVRMELPRQWRNVRVIYARVVGVGRNVKVEVSLDPKSVADGFTACPVDSDRYTDFETGRSISEMPVTLHTCVKCGRVITAGEDYYVSSPISDDERMCTNCF